MTSIEETITRAVSEAVERQIREQAPAIADMVAKRIGQPVSDELLTVDEAAQKAKVDPGTIRAWIKARRLRALRAGTRIRIKAAELERAMTPGPTIVSSDDISKQATRLARKMRGG